jgi:ATP/maltotriose-dependent transcriptional regulator MalT/DNA-binding MarR family transcriptional regulator
VAGVLVTVQGVTVGERIVVHLSGFLRHLDAYEVPPEMTQDGIGAALGISRAHVALELKRLKTAGKVEERMAHVANARTRRKVYALTPAGQEIARRMREYARARPVVLITPEGTRDATGEEALDTLRRNGVRESLGIQRILTGNVVDLRPHEAPPAQPPPGRAFFGRSPEQERLRDWLHDGPQPVAIIVGVAGIGKSALLTKVLAGETRPVLFRRLYQHDDGHGILSTFADFLARQGRRRLKTVLSRPAYDPVEAVAVLREDLAGCVVALDDFHACPPAEGLVSSLLEKPLACKLVVSTRVHPAFAERGILQEDAILTVPLVGLDEDASRELLAHRRPGLPPGDVAHVLGVTHGHPLALELFAASGLDAGALETERFVLQTVLEGLDDGSEEVLRTFAILRRPAKSPEALGATVAQLRRLLKRAVLQHRDEGYLLHDLVREFFLARMPDGDRRRAHGRAALYWEDRGDILEAAYHRIEAHEFDAGALLLEEQGEPYSESARAGELEACLQRLPPGKRPLRLHAETLVFLGRFEEASDLLEGMVRRGTPEERLRARIHLGRIQTRQGEYAAAQRILAAAVREAAAMGVPSLEGEALRALGGVERRLGNLGVAVDYLSRATFLLEDTSRERIRAMTDLGAALIARGDLPGAKSQLEEALRLARKGSREAAVIENNLAIVLSGEGKPQDAARAFERSAELALGAGEVRFASYALANAADNFLRLDETASASACAERALELASTIQDPMAVSTARANLGLVAARLGEWSRAERELLASVDLIARLDSPYSLASRCRDIAQVYEAQGRRDEAAPWRTRADGLFSRLRAAPRATAGGG